VTNNSSIVNINGHQYDAKTGKLLPGNTKSIIKKNSTPTKKDLVIDGVMRSSKPKTVSSLSSVAALSHPIPRPITQARPARDIHSRSSRSHTLNRTAVSKPAIIPKIHNRSKTPQKNTSPVHQPDIIATSDPRRKSMAQSTKRSRMIQKFMPAAIKKSSKGTPAVVQGEVVTNRSSKPDSSNTKSQPPIMPSTITSATHGNIDKLVDAALSSATAHKQKSPKKRHLFSRTPKLVSVGLALLIVVVLGGFFAYQYVPNIAVRVASTRAGLDASLPSYQPSGFTFKAVDTSPGTVVISYSANGDDQRQFKIMQKNSDWDSQSLLSNYVTQESKNYQTFNENGKTIYMFADDNATWVSRGVWFVVEGGTADLNSDQLLKIASSI
jgi:hypothetical protein